MSFFGQGFPYHHPAAHPYPGRRGPFPHTPAYPSFNYTHPSPPAYPTAENYYGQSPYAYPDQGDIDAEERAAVAHLEAIRRRREAASAHIAREAELRAERELAFQAVLQREREARERALERERERQRAIQAAHEERERAIRRRQEIARAEALQALKAKAIEAAKAKAYAIAQAQARQVAIAAQEKKRQYFQHLQAEQARRRACAARCGARTAEREVKKDEAESKQDDGLKVINDLLGGLFGINIALDDAAPATENKPESAQRVATEKKESTTAASNVKTDVHPAKETEKSAETKDTAKDTAKENTTGLPNEVNDLLSHFLGLRVDPAADTEAASGQPNKNVINGLNHILGQFGLEFEPTPAAETSNASASGSGSGSAASSAPAPTTESSAKQEVPKSVPENENKSTPTPIANFLNGHYDIPPFVRDILSNVEVALTQGQDFTPEPEVKGKGKGVAEGEKKARSTPVPDIVFESASPAETTDSTSSTDSIAKLDNISHELYLATESFEFPPKLAFAHPAETTELAPQLLFNKTNSGYHAQAHKLLQLLLAADGISSAGDKEVRQKRKEVVRAVEGAIEALEKRRDAMWDEVKVKRDNGEESEPEIDSSAASTTSDIEHVEHAELYENIPEESAQTQSKAEEKHEEAGEVVFDATEHEDEAPAATEVAAEEVPKVSVEEVADPHVEEEKKDVPAENEVVVEEKVEEKVEEEAKPTGASTPRSVTVEDQEEEGYEVL